MLSRAIASQLLQQFQRIEQEIEKDIDGRILSAERKSARAGIDIAKRFSSGPFKTAFQRQLARASGFPGSQGKGLFSTGATVYPGPFSKRRPFPLLPVGMINKQTGLFYQSWKVRFAYSTTSQRPTFVIYNDAPYAKFLEHGTKWAVARPLADQIVTILGPIRQGYLQEALDGTKA